MAAPGRRLLEYGRHARPCRRRESGALSQPKLQRGNVFCFREGETIPERVAPEDERARYVRSGRGNHRELKKEPRVYEIDGKAHDRAPQENVGKSLNRQIVD